MLVGAQSLPLATHPPPPPDSQKKEEDHGSKKIKVNNHGNMVYDRRIMAVCVCV